MQCGGVQAPEAEVRSPHEAELTDVVTTWPMDHKSPSVQRSIELNELKERLRSEADLLPADSGNRGYTKRNSEQ